MDELIPTCEGPAAAWQADRARDGHRAQRSTGARAAPSEHSQVVARYAELTARELDLPEDVVDDIRLAGLLHDVGKSGVPERSSPSRRPLSDIEWIAMRRHPELGAALLEDAGLDQIREWILLPPRAP